MSEELSEAEIFEMAMLTDRDKFVVEKTREYCRHQLHTKIKEVVKKLSAGNPADEFERGYDAGIEDLSNLIDKIMEGRDE